jgi:hypothetical protein
LGCSSCPDALLEARLRGRTHRVKPAADVHLSVSLATVMPGSGRCGSLRIPSEDGKLGVSASNHEPVDGIAGYRTTDFAAEFLQRRHVFAP